MLHFVRHEYLSKTRKFNSKASTTSWKLKYHILLFKNTRIMSRDSAHNTNPSPMTDSVSKKENKVPTAGPKPQRVPSAQPAQPPASPDLAARRIRHPRPGSKGLGVARALLSPHPSTLPNPTAPSTPRSLHYEGGCHPRAQRVSGRPEPASGLHVCRPGRRLPPSPGSSFLPTPSTLSKLPHLFHREKLKERKDQVPVQKVRDASSQVVLRHLAGGKGVPVR